MTSRYQKLEIALRYYLKGARYHTALEALDFALSIHTGTRKDGVTPEVQHQIEIALYCITLKDLIEEERTIVLSLLHDVVEDYPEVLGKLHAKFGPQITSDCQILNKTGKSYDKYFELIAADSCTSIVKGADRVHNVNSMIGVFSKEKQKKYIEEVNKHFLPMLKTARKAFPAQMDAYMNVMHMLRSQVNLLEGNL
jgi:(p)ppGpp synthase/HD superfamily hydrolase